MRTALESPQTQRARIRDILVSARVRTADLVACVNGLVAASGLAAIDPATFGAYNGAAGTDVASITAGATVLTSPDNPWTTDDVGKAIDVAGAGTAGGTLHSVIAGFNAAGSVTLRDAAVVTVTATVTAAVGLAIWGFPPSLALQPKPLMGADGSYLHSLTPPVPGGAGRQVGNVLGDVVNVLDFGAIGNGVADDTVAIQAAITAAGAAGQTVRIPAGVYVVSGITIGKQIRLCGDGTGSILQPNANATKVITVAAIGVAIESLAIQGTKTDETGGSQYGIYVQTGADGGLIRDVTFTGSSAAAGLNLQIHLQVVSNWRVMGCRFERVKGTSSGFGYGILFETCTACSMVDCVSVQSATNGRHHAYLSAGANECVVANNRFVSGYASQVAVYALENQTWCENNIIANNVCVGCADALVAGGAIQLTQKVRHNSVVGNVVRDAAQGIGIMVQGGTGAADSRAPFNEIVGNDVSGCGRQGIYLLGCDDCTVRGNTVRENSVASAGSLSGLQIVPNSANTPTQRNRVIANHFIGTTYQRSPWTVSQASGVRPSDTIISGNISPKGNFKWAQDDGDRTVFDEVYTVRRTLSYADFAAAATTAFVSLLTLGPGEKVESVIIKHEAAFSGGAISAYTISVGIAGSYTKYAGAFNVFQAVAATTFQNADTAGVENMATGETDIRALATSTGANTNAATAGQVNIWVRVRRYAMPVQ